MSKHYVWMACFTTFFTAGCSGPALEEVRGKVVINGKPVPAGTITFSPSSTEGKPATAQVQPDGTFQLTTYNKSDGALIGKHQVRYVAPIIDEDEKADDKLRLLRYYEVPSAYTVEVTSGENDFTIELQPKQQ